jgi:hypothetical protein
MAHMEAAVAQELLTMAEGGAAAGAEEEGLLAPSPTSGRGSAWLRRAALATASVAVVMLVGLSAKQISTSTAPAATVAPDMKAIKAYMEAGAVQAMGRDLTTQESGKLAQETERVRQLVATAQVRQLGVGSASTACQHDFGGQILRAVGRVSAQAIVVAVSCGNPDSEQCTTAQADAANLVQTMKDECVEEPSTDICTQSGSQMESTDVCIPKTCQNAGDLAAISGSHSSIACGGGGLGAVFNPLLNSMHMPGLPR